jgi:hypothetical protein
VLVAKAAPKWKRESLPGKDLNPSQLGEMYRPWQEKLLALSRYVRHYTRQLSRITARAGGK